MPISHLVSRPLVLALTIALTSATGASDWTQFRGTGGDGVSTQDHPLEWSEAQHVQWKVKIPGVAWSQPIIAGNKVLLTTAIAESQPRPRKGESGPGFSLFSAEGLSRALGNGGSPPKATYRWRLLCLDLQTAEPIWEQTVREAVPTIPIHRSNSYASETPVTDGKHVYVYVGMAGVYCFDLDGHPVWNRPVGTHSMQYGWGTGSSPLLVGNTLFLQCDNEKDSFLTAYDKATGDELWTVKRDERSNWSTPWAWKNENRMELITCGGQKTRSYDPQTGDLLWQLDSHGRSATTAVGDMKHVYVGSVSRSQGSSAALQAVRAGAQGDLSRDEENEFVVWSAQRAAPQLASPLLYDGCLYTLQQQGGIINCIDAATGKRHYRQRLAGAAGFVASPWAAGGNVFCLDEDGRTFVIAAGPEFKLRATNRLSGMFWSSPAIASGSLVLRSLDHLYCLAAKE